jgi:hypothetical protein
VHVPVVPTDDGLSIGAVWLLTPPTAGKEIACAAEPHRLALPLRFSLLHAGAAACKQMGAPR